MELTVLGVFILIGLLQTKHFIIDFILQPEWMFKNKGTLFHYGGLAHAFAHITGSFIVYALFGIKAVFGLLLFEFIAHYMIDLFKVQTNENLKFTPKDSGFWVLTGADQMLHQFCYLYIVAKVIGL